MVLGETSAFIQLMGMGQLSVFIQLLVVCWLSFFGWATAIIQPRAGVDMFIQRSIKARLLVIAQATAFTQLTGVGQTNWVGQRSVLRQLSVLVCEMAIAFLVTRKAQMCIHL